MALGGKNFKRHAQLKKIQVKKKLGTLHENGPQDYRIELENEQNLPSVY